MKESRRSSDAKAGPALVVEHLRKTYPETVAVDGISFTVEEGEIFGILGPNGAGKTTTVECAIGLRTPDSGTIRVMGFDPQVDRAQVHAIVGAQLQTSALQPRLRVSEILDLYRSFYRDPADAGELLDALGLREKRSAFYKSLSGGQKQRLSLALALVGRPKIAILDEMTTGLDPQARRDTWELIEGVRDLPAVGRRAVCHGLVGRGGSPQRHCCEHNGWRSVLPPDLLRRSVVPAAVHARGVARRRSTDAARRVGACAADGEPRDLPLSRISARHARLRGGFCPPGAEVVPVGVTRASRYRIAAAVWMLSGHPAQEDLREDPATSWKGDC